MKLSKNLTEGLADSENRKNRLNRRFLFCLLSIDNINIKCYCIKLLICTLKNYFGCIFKEVCISLKMQPISELLL